MNDEFPDIHAALCHLQQKCRGVLQIGEFVIDDKSLRNRTCYSRDEVKVLTRKMADHIGLTSCHFIVDCGKIEVSASGLIHLQDVLGFTKIQLDSELLYHPETLLMVLAHELTHKYLREHGAEYADESSNERLTDIASVALGFGKYILNGKYYSEYTTSGIRNVTVGYLTYSAFAVTYDMVCFMRCMTEDEIMDGLPVATRNNIWNARVSHREKYPIGAQQIRKAQADMEYIEAALEDCEKIAVPINKELDELTAWHRHLKSQLREIMVASDPDVLRRYLDQIAVCEQRTACLVEKLIPNGDDNARARGKREPWFNRVMDWLRSKVRGDRI